MCASDDSLPLGQRYSALVLNFRHWPDTVACVRSLFAAKFRPERVVVCDNGSGEVWPKQLANLCQGDGPGPRSWRILSRAEAEAYTAEQFPEDLLLVNNAANLGYAKGNNVGLKLLLHLQSPFIWLLNNDTEVLPEAPRALMQYMREHTRCGLCGALTRYLESPEIVQCYGGGWYNKIWGRGGFLGEGDRLALGEAPKLGQLTLDYVNGASVFLRREFLLEVGLMEEMYFLYCEELDWAERAKGRWDLGFAPDAVVLHREGLSTGLSNKRGCGLTLRALARLTRSRILFTLKFYPWALPTVLLGQSLAVLRKLAQTAQKVRT